MCVLEVIFGILFILTLIYFLGIAVGWYTRQGYVMCKSDKRLDGKTVIVTGGSSGIGFEVAKDLARRGAKLIFTSNSIKDGNEARHKIKDATLNEQVSFQHLDFASLESVREFAANILKTEERLDILINNAGVMLPDVITKDGMNFIMQVNHFGPFLLTLLLLPLLKRTGKSSDPSRIINTSSLAHSRGNIDFDKLNSVGHYKSIFPIYSNSKLCVAMFTRELAKRLVGQNVVVNSADPNIAATNIAHNWNLMTNIFYILWQKHFPTAHDAAQTTLHIALDQKAGTVNGEYFHNCKMTKAGQKVYDTETSAKLWDLSVRLVKLTDKEYEQIFSKTP